MNTDVRPNIDANKLVNVRRDIVENKRLSDSELEAIKSRIRANIKSTKLPVNSDATYNIPYSRGYIVVEV